MEKNKNKLRTDSENSDLKRNAKKLKEKISAEETVLRQKQTQVVSLVSQLETISQNPAMLEQHPLNLTNVAIGFFSIVVLAVVSLLISLTITKIRRMFRDSF